MNDVKSMKGTAFWMAPEVCLQSLLLTRTEILYNGNFCQIY